jgi:hypothetical protein
VQKEEEEEEEEENTGYRYRAKRKEERRGKDLFFPVNPAGAAMTSHARCCMNPRKRACQTGIGTP